MTLYTLSVFTHLKNTDLHALSAFETITKVMGFTALDRLNRFGHWTITLEAVSEEEAKLKVTKILENSYYILNPNKESYMLGSLPKASCKNNQTVRVIEVTQTIPYDDTALKTKIHQKVEIEIQKITKSLLWLMVVNTDTLSDIDKQLTDHVIKTTSRTEGLLVNPFYEDFSFVTEKVCPLA